MSNYYLKTNKAWEKKSLSGTVCAGGLFGKDLSCLFIEEVTRMQGFPFFILFMQHSLSPMKEQATAEFLQNRGKMLEP